MLPLRPVLHSLSYMHEPAICLACRGSSTCLLFEESPSPRAACMSSLLHAWYLSLHMSQSVDLPSVCERAN